MSESVTTEVGGVVCPSDECLMCTGEACWKCGAGCWNTSAAHCDHDVGERHEDIDEDS